MTNFCIVTLRYKNEENDAYVIFGEKNKVETYLKQIPNFGEDCTESWEEYSKLVPYGRRG